MPQLVIPIEVWQKMMAYVINCPTEVNGFGILELNDYNQFTLVDVFITDQVASAGDVQVDPLVVSQAMSEVMGLGYQSKQMSFQWHSHVKMQARFSTTDTENIDNWPGNRLISLVVNKFGEFECRLDLYQDGLRVAIPLVPTLVTTIPAAVMMDTARQISQKVKPRKSGVLSPRRTTDPTNTTGQEVAVSAGPASTLVLEQQL